MKLWQKRLIQLSSIIFFLFLWYLIAKLGLINLPGPFEVFVKFFSLLFTPEPVMGKTLIDHALASIVRVIIGAAIAFALAIPMGILLGIHKPSYTFFEPMIEILRPIPPIAWIPISIVLFGATGHIFIVFIGALYPALLNTMNGVKGVEKKFIDLAKTFKASQFQTITKVILPASLPSIITGMRIGLGVAWMSIIAAEMIALSGSGLGYFILVMYDVGHEAAMISGMIMIGLIGYIMNSNLLSFERQQ